MSRNKILPVVLLSLLIIFLLSFMTCLIIFPNNYYFRFNGKAEELYNEVYETDDVDSLNVDMISADIDVRYSEDEKIRVIINGYEKVKDTYRINLNNRELSITENSKPTFWFGFSSGGDNIIIYLPQSYKNDISLKGVSSDIRLRNDYDLDLTVKTTSGDVNINRINNINVETTSGEINIKSAKKVKASSVSGDIDINNLTNLDVKTVSGDVSLGIIKMTKNGKIKTTSGDVRIDEVKNVYVETKTTSGDVDINKNDRKADIILSITTVSGDITVG